MERWRPRGVYALLLSDKARIRIIRADLYMVPFVKPGTALSPLSTLTHLILTITCRVGPIVILSDYKQLIPGREPVEGKAVLGARPPGSRV